MHVHKVESSITGIMEQVKAHGESMLKSFDDVAEVLRLRVEDVEKALKRRDQAVLSMQENFQGISNQLS